MSYAAIHPDWERPRRSMIDGYSLEMTARELAGMPEAAPSAAEWINSCDAKQA